MSARVARRVFLPFKEARDHVRVLGLKSAREWKDWSKSGARPPTISSKPSRVYGDEFKGFRDFLGYERSSFRTRSHDISESLEGGSQWEKKRVTRKAGLQAFQNLVDSITFEFNFFTKESFITFLIRPKQHDDKVSDFYYRRLFSSKKNTICETWIARQPGCRTFLFFLPERIEEDEVIGRKYKWQTCFFVDMLGRNFWTFSMAIGSLEHQDQSEHFCFIS